MADWVDDYFEWAFATNGVSMGAAVPSAHRPELWGPVDIKAEFTLSADFAVPADYVVVLGRRGTAKIVELGWKDEDEYAEEVGDDDDSAAVRQSGSVLRDEG
jgi:hypothetical protein